MTKTIKNHAYFVYRTVKLDTGRVSDRKISGRSCGGSYATGY
jgi:hypothetical protein